ncbi:MAG: FAD-dependent oxidoreductase [Hyphomicrobiales bacterium]
MSSRVLVIGAGMAGLSAAKALLAAGDQPIVVDKSRGVGGRLATRRTPFGAFNHGAPTVSAISDPFKSFLTDADTAQWNGFGEAEGVPTMSALAKPLMGRIPLHFEFGVANLEVSGNFVKVTFSDGTTDGFDQAVLALPVPQAIQILSAEGVLASWAHALLDVKMAPCWAGLLAFDSSLPVLSLPTGVHLQKNGTVQSGTPSERWVFHADTNWSQENLERDKGEILADLSQLFFEMMQIDWREPVFSQAHKWRYARVRSSLNLPFLQSPDGRISVVGDAFAGSGGLYRDAEAAFHSGQSVAQVPARIFN